MPSMKQHLEGYTRTQRAYMYVSQSHKRKCTMYTFLLAVGVTQGLVMGQTKYILCIPIRWVS